MTQEVFIRTGPGERRVSLTKNGKLNRVQIDRTGEKSAVDGIYFGRITEVNRSLNAAFVDIGMENAGFLAAVDAQSFDHSRERPKPIGQLFSEGETVLVQVTRDSLNGKGAKLTTNLSISAFNLILKPWNTFYTIPHVHVYECQEILLCCVAWVLFCQKKSEAKTKKCCKKSCKKKLQNGSQAKHCFPLLTNKAEKR